MPDEIWGLPVVIAGGELLESMEKLGIAMFAWNGKNVVPVVDVEEGLQVDV